MESLPVDISKPVDASSLKNQTVLITGGASGFGAAFSAEWAAHGATVIIGDINHATGEKLVAKLRSSTINEKIYFIPLDVTDWSSQLSFFRQACRISPHGGIDHVIANAGVSGGDECLPFEDPQVDYETAASPPAPSLKILDVNIKGVMYTSHLAMYYLPRNPGSQSCNVAGNGNGRDRHLLLLGSLASLLPLPGGSPYSTSKHAVLGLFRSLRYTASIGHGIRTNILCPYFVDTPILTASMKALLAGSAKGTIADVVEAATRFVSDRSIVGRGLAVGPKVKIKSRAVGREYTAEDFELLNEETPGGEKVAIWDCNADNQLEGDMFAGRILRLINAASVARGWAGIAVDLVGALMSPVQRLWSGS